MVQLQDTARKDRRKATRGKICKTFDAASTAVFFFCCSVCNAEMKEASEEQHLELHTHEELDAC